MPITCTQCGETNKDEAQMCSLCGLVLKRVEATPPAAPSPKGPGAPSPKAAAGPSPKGPAAPVPQPKPMPKAASFEQPPEGGTMAPRNPVPRHRQAVEGFEPAGVIQRGLAFIIDLIGMWIFWMIMTLLIAVVAGALSIRVHNIMADKSIVTRWFYMLSILTIYSSIFEASRFHGSPGKIAWGLLVIDKEANEPTGPYRAFFRNLFKNITIIYLQWRIGFWLAGLFSGIFTLITLAFIIYIIVRFWQSDDRLAVHDFLSGSQVVRRVVY